MLPNPNPIKLKYELQGVISKSKFTEVYTAISLEKNKKVIIIRTIFQKLCEKSDFMKDLIQQEIYALKKIKNLNVVECIDHFQDVNSFYLVEHYCNCSNLDQLLKSKGRLQEQEAIGILKQILNGLQGLHKQNMMYRDLRPCKILMHNHTQVKLQSFAISAILMRTQSDQIEQIINCFDTIAPEEVEHSQFGLQADVFSIGCIFYYLLFGKSPFPMNTRDEYLQAIKKQTFDLQSVEISKTCIQLLQQMLQSDPIDRITFSAIFNHQYFKDNAWSNIGVSSFQIQASAIDVNNIRLFYQNKSLEIDQQIKYNSEQLDKQFKKLKDLPQKQEKVEEQIVNYKDIMQDIIDEQMKSDQIQQKDQILDFAYKWLNRVFYVGNTIQEFNQTKQQDPLGIQKYFLLKVQMELLKIQQYINKNNQLQNQNQNEYDQLNQIVEQSIQLSEYQLDELKTGLKQSTLDFINNIKTPKQLNKIILKYGVQQILELKDKPLRVHKHQLKCIINRDLEKATFEPNLQLEFEIAGINNEAEIQEEMNELLNQL